MYSLEVKTSLNWRAKRSGDLNKLNTDYLFETDNEYGFPEVETSKDFSAEDLIGFNLCKKKREEDKNKAVHFFLDDYKFEPVWASPKKYIDLFRFYGNCVSPTFSVWDNQPMALNLFNVYRSRWFVRFLQEIGVNALVDVRWAGENSYDYCFSGIKKYSPVILNTVGLKRKDNRELFVKGFYCMIDRVQPQKLYIYGEVIPLRFEKYVDEVVYFESFWKKQRDKIKKG